MGAMTNNGRKLANFAGFYKGIQSAGAVGVWALDLKKYPFMNIFASCWILLAGSLILALPVILLKIQDSVSLEQDLKFTDESLTDVVPPGTTAFEAARAQTATGQAAPTTTPEMKH